MPRTHIDFSDIKCKNCEIQLVSGNVHREYKNGIQTGKWFCRKCWYHIDYKNRDCEKLRRKDIQSVGSRRSGNQNPKSNNAKGDQGEELTCRWRSTISTISVKNLNIENDNYRSPIDHSIDSELGVIQTRTKWYDSVERYWMFAGLQIDWLKEFDHYIFYCISKDGKHVDRIYIIPKEEVVKTCVKIIKNPTNSHSKPIIPWYEKYRITNEEVLKMVNKIWEQILKEKSYRGV